MRVHPTSGKLRLLAMAIALVAVLAACGGGEETAEEPTDDAPTTEDREPTEGAAEGADGVIHFGASLSLTGGLATEGRLVRDGYDFMVEQINEAGGIPVGDSNYQVEITYYDDESEPETAARLVERLIVQDEVDFLLGPYSSGATFPASSVAEQHEMPMVVAHAAATTIYERGFENLWATLNSIDQYFGTILEMVAEHEDGPESVAIINENALAPQLAADAAEEIGTELGLEVLYKEHYPSGTTDLSSLLAAVRDEDPDMLIGAGYTGDMILLRRQMDDLGYVPNLTAFMLGPTLPGFVEDLGDLAEGILEPVQWAPNMAWEDEVFGWSAQDYSDMFEERFGYAPDYHPPQSSAALMVYYHALQEVGSLDRDQVRDAIDATDIMTFYGPVRFNELGQNVGKEMAVVQIQDGEPVVVYPAEHAQADLMYPTAD
jgi:branched-chain amino acid transport system substrate-binding protein